MSGRGFLALGLSLFSMGMAAGDAKKAGLVAGGPYAVQAIKDLAYYEGPDADPKKHKLNLFLPKDAKSFPVVLFIHGGGWRFGDRDFLFDVYGKLGDRFARNGVGLAVASYRLSPKVKHPEHAKDVARAFAWTAKHLRDYGGNPDELFVCGHSAGGHLVSLLATAESYLKEHGLERKAIRGVIGISGVYEVSPEKRFFPSVFPEDAAVRREASPLYHVKAGVPPTLLIYADSDFPTLDRLAQRYHQALRAAEIDSELLEVQGRDHFSILTRMLEQEDPAFQATLRFIARHAKLELKSLENAGK